MSESEPKRTVLYPNIAVSALNREDWESGLEQSIADGLSEPGETYEDYIWKLRSMFGVVFAHRKQDK